MEVKIEYQKQKDYKAEVHRLAENICGDWSEHISSTGKRYYYNCRTEISQWEKPEDWSNLHVTSSSSHISYNSQLSAWERPTISEEQNEDEDDMQLVSTETTSNSKKCESLLADEYSRSPVVIASDGATTTGSVSLADNTDTGDRQHSFQCCLCVESTSALSPTHVTHCLLNSVMSSSLQVEMMNKHNASMDSDRTQVDGEDMDISPGCIAPEELRLAEQTCTTTLPRDQQSSDPYTVVETLTEDSTSNSTFLNTLGKLQQALQQVTVDKISGGNSSKAVPSSVLSLLATLPSLIYKLKSAGEPQTSTLCQSQPVDQQQITVQVIQMLQNLQQKLVAQQQQQQQRQLHELLLQLLAVHKLGTSDNLSPSFTVGQQESPVRVRQHVDHVESPYSPPDSDGTPLGSPNEQRILSSTADCSLALPDTEGKRQTPNSHLEQTEYKTRRSSTSPVRQRTPSPKSSLSTPLPSVSHLAVAAVTGKQDSVGLTPTLSNYVNTQLMDHIAGWQTDIAERQANCYAEESYTLSSLHCAEVSVDLKRARSLVRVNEIQSTLQEQRVMFMRQHTRDLETLRTSNSYYCNVPSDS